MKDQFEITDDQITILRDATNDQLADLYRGLQDMENTLIFHIIIGHGTLTNDQVGIFTNESNQYTGFKRYDIEDAIRGLRKSYNIAIYGCSRDSHEEIGTLRLEEAKAVISGEGQPLSPANFSEMVK